MVDLTAMDEVSGNDLTEEQIKGILTQIDLDITNLVREGKLSALNYSIGGQASRTADRAGNLRALLEARSQYQQLINSLPSWNLTSFEQTTHQKEKATG